MHYDITPMGKPRMTQRDRWKGRDVVKRYHAFKDACRDNEVLVSSCDTVIFYMPMPKSWSKKKRNAMRGKPHCNRPDLDNLLKALYDAVLLEDSHIWGVQAYKVWSDKGGILISPASHDDVRNLQSLLELEALQH